MRTNRPYQPRPPMALRGILWARHKAYSATPLLIAMASPGAIGQSPYVSAVVLCRSLVFWLLSNTTKAHAAERLNEAKVRSPCSTTRQL